MNDANAGFFHINTGARGCGGYNYRCNSGSNNLSKKIISLNNRKTRDKLKMFIVEGEKFVNEITVDYDVCEYVFSSAYAAQNDLGKYLSTANCFIFDDSDFAKFSGTVTPQGILAVCKQNDTNPDRLLRRILHKPDLFLLIAENLSDPGNMGTLIRTADACGCDAVVLSADCVDVYNPKVIRSTAGSIFHLPVVCCDDIFSIINLLKEHNVLIAGAHLSGDKMPYEADLRKSCAIIIGNEANGLSDNISHQADNLLKIPMPGKAESLNASVASGMLLYEVVRQRLLK